MTTIINFLLTTTLILVNIPKERIFIYLNGQRVAMEENGRRYFYHNDHLGGTNIVTDEAGRQVTFIDYQPFGETKTEEGGLNVKKKFTGKELDDSTGLYDYAARMYDPKLGRFISADIAQPDLTNPQSLNRYSYCLNNPLKYIDPTGYWEEDILWYDRLSTWRSQRMDLIREFVSDRVPQNKWGWAAGALFYAVAEMGSSVVFDTPAQIGHFGEGTGKFINDPSWETAPGILIDVATAASIIAVSVDALPSSKTYWQYYPEGVPSYKTDYLVRSRNPSKAPHKPGKEAQEALNLPPHNPGTAVRKVKVDPLKEPIAGPRTPKPKPQWGWDKSGKGREFYRGQNFPD